MRNTAALNQDLRWKNILLVLLIVLGLIYALPNLYGEDPAVQISGKDQLIANKAVISKVTSALQAGKYSYKSIQQQGTNQILIRFKNTTAQLNAQDIIKAALGDKYSVAVNLAQRTPAWLRALGAKPMKLGLDLRGGVHFLLNVDMSAMYKRQLQGDVRTLREGLRKERVRYASIRLQGNNIALNFRETKAMNAARSYILKQQTDLVVSLDTQNPNQLLAHMSPAAVQKLRQSTVDRVITTLRNRINELGVSEPMIQQQGANRVAVDLPGIQDTARAKEILGGTATVEFYMVDDSHDAQAAVAGHAPLGTRLYYEENGQPILLKKRLVLSGNAINNARASTGEDGMPIVNIWISGNEVSFFSKITAENVGKRMGTVFVETKTQRKLVNGKVVTTHKKIQKVISAATIIQPLGNQFYISGVGNMRAARNLALLLRSGALPVPVSYAEERTVGPSLGAQNIERGMVALAVGFIIIVLFMAAYYRVFGLVADVALFLNLILLVALLSILGMTLTLPGIAALVLTLGMAVDANVLIYERIREELRNSMSPQAAIHAGFGRAFVTIVDANVTTFIVALVLFTIGSGAIKGFAVVLTFGLMTSMLTATTYTRSMVNLVYGGRRIEKLSIGI